MTHSTASGVRTEPTIRSRFSEKRVKGKEGGNLHKHVEQLAVEIVRLSPVRAGEDCREQSHLLHNQVLL